MSAVVGRCVITSRWLRAALLASALAWGGGCTQPWLLGHRAGEPRVLWHVATAPTDATPLSVHGQVVTHRLGDQLVLTLLNRGATPIRLSAVVDRYTAKTFDGRMISLTPDFLSYPDLVAPGQEQQVTVPFPRALRASQVSELSLQLEMGRHVLRLQPVAPVTPMAGAEPPIGTMPVVIECAQRFGTTMAVEVRWDEASEAVTLRHGSQQTFALMPGPHALHLAARLPGIAETTAHVPVLITTHAPTHIDLEVQPRLTGIELHVRVAEGSDTVSESTF